MLKPALQLRIGQQLTMTPQLQQAIRLLQLPSLELQAHVREVLESNVMLEVDEDSATEAPGADTREEPGHAPGGQFEAPDREPTDGNDQQETPEGGNAGEEWEGPTAAVSDTPWSFDDERDQDLTDPAGQSLKEQLLEQLDLARLSPVDMAIAHVLVDAINDDGYLQDSIEEICASLRPEIITDVEQVDRILAIVQTLEPAGVGARSPGECIALQLRQLDPATAGRSIAIRIAQEHLDLVASQQLTLLRRHLRCSGSELEAALALVRSCHPRPGSTVTAAAAEYVIPDVFVRRSEHGWTVEINPSTLPRVRVNQGYANLVSRSADHAMLRTQLQEARWLLRSLEIRNETLLKVARCIIRRQARFFDVGDEGMQPLILKDVASEVEMHESTISRVTTAKYMHTPRGVFEFRHFFSSHVEAADGTGMSSTAIRARIRKLIAQEDPGNPLSDAGLARVLSQEGIPVARRTVAKYREAMQIEPSNERKRSAARA